LVRTYVKNDKRFIVARNILNNDVSLYITMPDLRGVDLNGSGNIDAVGDFEENAFTINVNGSGCVKRM